MSNTVDVDFLWDCLRSIFDPEVGINIVDLGLIYAVETVPTTENRFIINIEMTLTSPTCPLADVIISDIKSVLSFIRECDSVNVKIVFDPPWNYDMITENGKMELGLL